jgi:ribosome-associated protein
MDSKLLAKKVVQLAWNKKGKDIILMDLKKVMDVTDYFILITGESDIHVKALANHIEKELKKEQIDVWHKEGFRQLKWVLMDYIDIVIHIFRPDVREYYNLEKLWADAKITKIKDHAPNPILSET